MNEFRELQELARQAYATYANVGLKILFTESDRLDPPLRFEKNGIITELSLGHFYYLGYFNWKSSGIPIFVVLVAERPQDKGEAAFLDLADKIGAWCVANGRITSNGSLTPRVAWAFLLFFYLKEYEPWIFDPFWATVTVLSDDRIRPTEQTTAATTSKANGEKRKANRKELAEVTRTKIIAALTLHHKYANSSALFLEPVSLKFVQDHANVAKATVSRFFKTEFQGYDKYKIVCRDPSLLVASLKMLNDEFSPFKLYPGATLDDLTVRDEDEEDD